jgi:hypothetical protein
MYGYFDSALEFPGNFPVLVADLIQVISEFSNINTRLKKWSSN